MTNAEKFKEVFGFKPDQGCDDCPYTRSWWDKTYCAPIKRADVNWNVRIDYILTQARIEDVVPIYWVYKKHPEWLGVLVPSKRGGVQINDGALEKWLEGGEFE